MQLLHLKITKSKRWEMTCICWPNQSRGTIAQLLWNTCTEAISLPCVTKSVGWSDCSGSWEMTLQSLRSVLEGGVTGMSSRSHGEECVGGRTTRVVDVDNTNQDGANVCKATFTITLREWEIESLTHLKTIFLIFMEPWSTSKPMSRVPFLWGCHGSDLPIYGANYTGGGLRLRYRESWCNKPKDG